MIINNWRIAGINDFCDGKDYNPPANYYDRLAYQSGWLLSENNPGSLAARQLALSEDDWGNHKWSSI